MIVLFSSSGLRELPAPDGILGFKNVSAQSTSYDLAYQGLQYYGKGGTSPFNPIAKLKQNIKKQSKLMQGAGALGNPEVIGMMYWTTTGLVESITKRDDGMWDAPNISKMKALWGQGLGDFVNSRVSLPSSNRLASAAQRRSLFPNIVMIDFADNAKCQQIRDLNALTAQHVAAVV